MNEMFVAIVALFINVIEPILCAFIMFSCCIIRDVDYNCFLFGITCRKVVRKTSSPVLIGHI